MATAPTTYKVKKGDTLSKIASTLGVGVDDIGGYKSGNKDLIFADEVLTVGKTPKTNITQDKAGKMSTKDLSIALAGGDYAGAVKDELGDDTEGSGYGKWESDYNDYKSKRDSAYENLKNISTETFDSEYKKRKLDKKKERISTIDNDIAEARQLRDDAIFKVKSNPGLSAAQMTGDIAKLSEAQNAVINNLIGQRNSVASEYNADLDEIDGIVTRAGKDAQLEFTYWDGLISETGTRMSEYDKALREELKAETEQRNFEKQLAQQLMIAQMNDATSRSKGGSGGGSSKDNWKLVYDDYGNPLYWFNSKTKEIDYNVAGSGNTNDTPTDNGSPTNFDTIEQEASNDSGSKSTWWNPLTWFK